MQVRLLRVYDRCNHRPSRPHFPPAYMYPATTTAPSHLTPAKQRSGRCPQCLHQTGRGETGELCYGAGVGR
jgi:hypothetical protein